MSFFIFVLMAQFYFFFRPFISDKTDLESTHSSNMSGLPEKQIIPPDALYTSNEKMMNMKNSGYISYEHVFNDSKVRTLLFTSVTQNSKASGKS